MKRRTLGQHFLIREEVLDRLVSYGRISKEDVVLEVGAGRGELTKRIAEKAGKVIAVELDESLASEAMETLKNYSNVELLVGDVLELRPKGFNKVVSNPPYSISTRLLEWLIDSLPEIIVLTLQREFASKLLAKPGSRKYLFTSFLAQLFYEIQIAEIVPRIFFKPVPRVDSAIVVMVRRMGVRRIQPEEKRFLKLLFTRRRQILRKILKSFLRRDLGNLIPDDILSKRIYQLRPEELLLCSSTLIKLRSSLI